MHCTLCHAVEAGHGFILPGKAATQVCQQCFRKHCNHAPLPSGGSTALVQRLGGIASHSHPHHHYVGRLWGHGHGRFRTHGVHSITGVLG